MDPENVAEIQQGMGAIVHKGGDAFQRWDQHGPGDDVVVRNFSHPGVRRRDGLDAHAAISIGPYSLLVFSQDV